MLSTIGIRAGSRVTMARLEQIEGLMEQLGPVLDPLNVTAFPGEKAWGVQVDEDTAVLVDFDEEQGKLVLSCEIGAPPAGDRSKLYELLLRHNFHWEGPAAAASRSTAKAARSSWFSTCRPKGSTSRGSAP